MQASRRETSEKISAGKATTIIVSIGIVAAAAFVAFVANRAIVRPIRALLWAMTDVAHMNLESAQGLKASALWLGSNPFPPPRFCFLVPDPSPGGCLC